MCVLAAMLILSCGNELKRGIELSSTGGEVKMGFYEKECRRKKGLHLQGKVTTGRYPDVEK